MGEHQTTAMVSADQRLGGRQERERLRGWQFYLQTGKLKAYLEARPGRNLDVRIAEVLVLVDVVVAVALPPVPAAHAHSNFIVSALFISELHDIWQKVEQKSQVYLYPT